MRKFVALAAAAVLSLVGAVYPRVMAAQQGRRGGVCREVALTQKPGWTISGSWSADGSLLLVDPLYRTIQRYSSTGSPRGPIGEPLQSSLRDFLPIAGKSRATDLILQVSDGLMRLDGSYRPLATKSFLVTNQKKRNPVSIGALWQWEPVGKGDILGFGDVYQGNPNLRNNWYSAFVRFPLDEPRNFKVFRPLGLDDDETNFLRLGFPYIAAIGDTAYVLSMANQMALYKNEASSEGLVPLAAFPPGLGFSPSTLAQFNSWQNYVSLMETVEKVEMPVGLYAWDGSLYILSRAPNGAKTRWTLHSINPTRDEYTGRVDLPINANHVVVVPGPQVWAFVEKGPVLGKGLQDVSRILFVPSQKLRAPLKRTGAGCPQ